MAFVNTFVPKFSYSSKTLKQSSFVRPTTSKKSTAIIPSKVSSPSCPNKTTATRMLFGLLSFITKDITAIPQKDSQNKQNRKEQVKEMKEKYQWNKNMIGTSPMVDGVPREEYPAFGWIEGILKVIFRVLSNDLSIKFKDNKEDFLRAQTELLKKITTITASIMQKLTLGLLSGSGITSIVDEISDLFSPPIEGKGYSFQEYKDLFQVFKPDTVAKLDQFLRDDIFGWYRVAGPNPLHFRKANDVKSMFPEFTNDILKGISGFGGDSIEEIIKDNRLYYIDYKDFDGIEPGVLPDGKKKEKFHLYAPTAILAVPKVTNERTTILPLAIRCGQGNEYPMYTPNPKHTDEVTWIAAKCAVQVADGVMHETRYHLGRTHLLLEIFVCSARRSLAPSHPLMKFLAIHFEGTAFINYLGYLKLASPGGVIDTITAPQIETTTKVCTDAIKGDFSYNEWMPDKEFEARGVTDTKHLKYPFRDDALKLWSAINEWVRAYVTAYYDNDDDVKNDYELAEWCKEIVNPDLGGVQGFGENAKGEVFTIDYLVRFISSVVYIGSVQHAAVNFAQGAYMQFVPAMPLTGFDDAPKTKKPYRDIDHFVEEMLPELSVATSQLNTIETLSAFQWTSLGEYGRDLKYAPDSVDDALKIFKERLSKIGSEIQDRNGEERVAGLPVYDFLVPRNIPQSTNV